MTVFLARADEVLRGRSWAVGRADQRLVWLAGLLVVFGMAYGLVMGSFGGLWGERFLQLVYSALKVPLLLGATFALSLPSFFVINTLAGVF